MKLQEMKSNSIRIKNDTQASTLSLQIIKSSGLSSILAVSKCNPWILGIPNDPMKEGVP